MGHVEINAVDTFELLFVKSVSPWLVLKKEKFTQSTRNPCIFPTFCPVREFYWREDSSAAFPRAVEQHFSESPLLPNQGNYFTCLVRARNSGNQLQTDLPFYWVTYSFLSLFSSGWGKV